MSGIPAYHPDWDGLMRIQARAARGEAPSPTNYLRTGKWSQCAHCFMFYAGEHYCGAPWQTAPIGDGIDEISAEWAAAVGKYLYSGKPAV